MFKFIILFLVFVNIAEAKLPKEVSQYQNSINFVSYYTNMKADVLTAVMWQETHFRPRPSPTGAQGVMQIVGNTYKDTYKRHKIDIEIGKFLSWNPLVPQKQIENMLVGSIYLRELIKKFGVSDGLLAYNIGPTRLTNLRKMQIDPHIDFGYAIAVESKMRRLTSQN